MGRRLAFACVALTAAVARAQTPPPADDERLNVRAEGGLELDTNAHRTEIIAGVPKGTVVRVSGEQPSRQCGLH